MKHITPEIKARVFALYWGQQIINAEGLSKLKRMDELNPLRDGDSLEVKPLSSITDEDAEHLGTYLQYFGMDDAGGFCKDVQEFKKHLVNQGMDWDYYGLNNGGYVFDYLRSKGYALPAFGYSVDELVEAGVFKIKEVNND